MSRFLSEIQGKYTKLAKIIKISISFNRLAFPANLTESQPLDTKQGETTKILEDIIYVKQGKGLIFQKKRKN